MSATILLADDNGNIREYCRRELEDDGYRVTLARHGGEALEALRGTAFDMVVLDIAMPVANGFEVLEQIRQGDATTPVVFFTSFDESCMDDPRARLATACIEKRGDLGELKRTVAAILKAERGRESYRAGLPQAAADASTTTELPAA